MINQELLKEGKQGAQNVDLSERDKEIISAHKDYIDKFHSIEKRFSYYLIGGIFSAALLLWKSEGEFLFLILALIFFGVVALVVRVGVLFKSLDRSYGNLIDSIKDNKIYNLEIDQETTFPFIYYFPLISFLYISMLSFILFITQELESEITSFRILILPGILTLSLIAFIVLINEEERKRFLNIFRKKKKVQQTFK